MKTMFNASKAIEILGGIKVPSEIANSVEVIEALRMAIEALNMQINVGQMIQDIKDDFDENDSYSVSLVMDILNDAYMFSEVNNGEV